MTSLFARCRESGSSGCLLGYRSERRPQGKSEGPAPRHPLSRWWVAHHDLGVKTWSQIINDCKSRLRFFAEKLKYAPDRDSSLQHLKTTYHKYLADLFAPKVEEADNAKAVEPQPSAGDSTWFRASTCGSPRGVNRALGGKWGARPQGRNHRRRPEAAAATPPSLCRRSGCDCHWTGLRQRQETLRLRQLSKERHRVIYGHSETNLLFRQPRAICAQLYQSTFDHGSGFSREYR